MSVTAIISIGSNLPGARGYTAVAAAMETLSADYREIARSSIYRTSAVGSHASGIYCNSVQALEVDTTEVEPVVKRLKQIEKAAGRISGSSEVAVDLDLVILGGVILRPADVQQGYFARGYAELLSKLG